MSGRCAKERSGAVEHADNQLGHHPGHAVPADTRGRSPLTAGMMLLPFSLAVIAGSALAAPALARWVPQRVATGLSAIAVCDAALILAAASPWGLPVCVAVGGAGIGLSSVAATGLGTSVAATARGTASGIINTAAQLGTALGIAVLLLVAAMTTGVPAHGTPAPAVAWAVAAMVSIAGAAAFTQWSRCIAAYTSQLSAASEPTSDNPTRDA